MEIRKVVPITEGSRRKTDPDLDLNEAMRQVKPQPDFAEEIEADPSGHVKHWLKLSKQLFKGDPDPHDS